MNLFLIIICYLYAPCSDLVSGVHSLQRRYVRAIILKAAVQALKSLVLLLKSMPKGPDLDMQALMHAYRCLEYIVKRQAWASDHHGGGEEGPVGRRILSRFWPREARVGLDRASRQADFS